MSKIIICFKEGYIESCGHPEEKYGGLELERVGHWQSLSILVIATGSIYIYLSIYRYRTSGNLPEVYL
jgi:hypothetical protein